MVSKAKTVARALAGFISLGGTAANTAQADLAPPPSGGGGGQDKSTGQTDPNRSTGRRGVVAAASVTAALLGLTVPIVAQGQFTGALCFVTGGGTIDGDSFGGTAKVFRDGTADGSWTHNTLDGRTLQGDVDILGCTRNGGDPEHPDVPFSIAHFSGTGRFDGQDVTFSVQVEDDGEPGAGRDTYAITIVGPGGNLAYNVGGIIDTGNVQIIPANPGHP
jgi:hypothetical protein